jgi:branched-subunit amino acid aminotransferase/4-amino-4-deoxychorismate lyase
VKTLSVFVSGRLVQRTWADDELLVADSWLVADGAVRWLTDHRHRFWTACRGAGVDDERLQDFWHAVVEALPRTGRWFPRVELSCSGELRLRLRPAPPLGLGVALHCNERGDPRRSPRLKGPDLPLLLRLKAEAARHGASEHLLRTAEGWVVEGTTTSLLWWESDTLCVPAQNVPSLPGVTSKGLLRRAAELGIAVAHMSRQPEALSGREVWLVNALHGIRPVTRWSGLAVQPGKAVNAPAWQNWLRAQLCPLPHTHAARALPAALGELPP